MKARWGGGADCPARLTLWLAVALLLAVSVLLLLGGWQDTQARLAERGSYCLRTGPLRNADGERVGKGLWWGPDGKRHEVKL